MLAGCHSCPLLVIINKCVYIFPWWKLCDVLYQGWVSARSISWNCCLLWNVPFFLLVIGFVIFCILKFFEKVLHIKWKVLSIYIKHIYFYSEYFIFYIFGQITTDKMKSNLFKKKKRRINFTMQFACRELSKTAFKHETLY